MKINEKTVASFAVCSSPVDMEGYLFKRGELNKGFQRRWFVLKGNLLFYFEKKQDKEPVGLIVLENCSVQASEVDKYAFELLFEGTNTRTYVLQADTEEELDLWMKSVAHASYEYLKAIVQELQGQLDTIMSDRMLYKEREANGGNKGKVNGRATVKEISSRSEEVDEIPPEIPKKIRSSSVAVCVPSLPTHSSDYTLLEKTKKSHSVDGPPFSDEDNIDEEIPPFPIPEEDDILQSPPFTTPLSPSPEVDPTPIMEPIEPHGENPIVKLQSVTNGETKKIEDNSDNYFESSPRRVRSKVLVNSESPLMKRNQRSLYTIHHELGDALKVLNPEIADQFPPLPTHHTNH